MEQKPSDAPGRADPSFDPDKTNPHIDLPPTTVRPEDIVGNPLEALVPDVDERIRALEERVKMLNAYIRGRTYEYGGIKLKNPQVTLDLELTGEDENGVKFLVPKEEVHLFLESIK